MPTPRVTLKAIHDELQARGYDVRLEKGDGYFYFWSGEANDWLDRTVNVPTLHSLTPEQWVEEFQRLRKLNQEIQRSQPRAIQTARSQPAPRKKAAHKR